MSAQKINWRNARIPDRTAVFVIGDVHSHSVLLTTMLEEIEEKIDDLPEDVSIYIIFLGDYTDRGPDAPGTIDRLLRFEKRMSLFPNVNVVFLCGNHEEYLTRLLKVTEIIEIAPSLGGKDLTHAASQKNGELGLGGLGDWLFKGGGITTVRDYCPAINNTIFDIENQRLNLENQDFSLEKVNKFIHTFINSVPSQHRDFWNRIYDNNHFILGDYLFLHSGIDPERTLEEQGIGYGKNVNRPQGIAYLEQLMIRNRFLWRDCLPNCPYVVVHGHTPSAIDNHRDDRQMTIADGQKDYRLCIDTAVYTPNGALTCFARYEDDAYFMAVRKSNPLRVVEYSISDNCQFLSQEQHQRRFPEYHNLYPDNVTNN